MNFPLMKMKKKNMLVKARCFPRWAAPATHAALEPSAEDARWFEPIAKHATHVLDVVCHRNRATLTLWPAEAVEAPAKRRGGGDDAEARDVAERDASLSSDWKPRLSDVVHDACARTTDSTVLPYPPLPPPHVATLEYLIAQHCERVKEARASKKPMSRAYFKLEEAADRAGVPLSSDWQCVDVGAAPGGGRSGSPTDSRRRRRNAGKTGKTGKTLSRLAPAACGRWTPEISSCVRFRQTSRT